jgi:hypothetical protein
MQNSGTRDDVLSSTLSLQCVSIDFSMPSGRNRLATPQMLHPAEECSNITMIVNFLSYNREVTCGWLSPSSCRSGKAHCVRLRSLKGIRLTFCSASFSSSPRSAHCKRRFTFISRAYLSRPHVSYPSVASSKPAL